MRDADLSGPQEPWGLARLSSFRPPGTVGTGGTQSLQAPRHPEDWRGPILPQVPSGQAGLSNVSPGTPEIGRAQFIQPPTHPWGWRDSVLSGPQVPWGLAGFGHFSPPGTLGTGYVKQTGNGEPLSL